MHLPFVVRRQLNPLHAAHPGRRPLGFAGTGLTGCGATTERHRRADTPEGEVGDPDDG